LVLFVLIATSASGLVPAQTGAPQAPDLKPLVLDLGDGVKMEFMRIPKGKFTMGSPATEKGRKGKADEEKRHEVEITRDFYLGKHEVTNGQFALFVRETNYRTDGEKDARGSEGYDTEAGRDEFNPKYSWRNPGFVQTNDHPAILVSWNDAVRFCEWLSKKTGKSARLPTEAEWEYACRAGTTTRYYHGDDSEARVQVGNLADGTHKKRYPNAAATQAEDGYVFTSPVGRFKPNAFGLYDMHGNAYEWCQDWLGPYDGLNAKDPVRTEKAANARAERVIRSGSWKSPPDDGRSAARAGHVPQIGYSRTGMRVALEAD
jgi:formylglycine-generating enzyme required for sulfatase activity